MKVQLKFQSVSLEIWYTANYLFYDSFMSFFYSLTAPFLYGKAIPRIFLINSPFVSQTSECNEGKSILFIP